MRIGLAACAIERGRSGTGQYVLGLLRALLRHAARPEIVVFTSEADAPAVHFARDAARIVTLPSRPTALWPEFAWPNSALSRAAAEARVDVLHVPHPRLLTWHRGCALVATVPDARPFEGEARWSQPATWGRAALLRAVVQRQHELICPTAAAAADIAAVTGRPAAPIHVIPPGVDARRFHPAGRDGSAGRLARRHGVPLPFFLVVGRLGDPAANLGRVIAAFNRFKTQVPSPWRLVLLGPAGDWTSAVADAVRHSPYAPDIHCPGAVGAAELPDWYRVAGGLIHVAPHPGFGLPLLEAMASGCPILAADTPGERALCGDAAAYAPTDDVPALARQLAAFGGDAGLRQRLRHAGLERSARFNWDGIAEAVLAVYGRAIRRAQTAPAAVAAPPVTV